MNLVLRADLEDERQGDSSVVERALCLIRLMCLVLSEEIPELVDA